MIKRCIVKYRRMPLGMKASFWFMVCSAVQNGASFLSMPFLVRLLTAEEYGIYCVFRSWINIIAIFSTLKMSTEVFNNAMFNYPDRRDKYTASAQSISISGTAIWMIVYLAFNRFWDNVFGLPAEISIMIFIQLFFTESYAVWTAKQRYEYKYRNLVISTTVFSLLYLFVPVSVGYFAAKSVRLVAIVYSSVAVQICFGFGFMIYNYAKGKCFFNKEYWKFAIGFNLPLIPHFLSSIILGESDRVMIKNMVGAAEAGIYSFIYTVAIIVNIITSAIRNAIIPFTYNALAHRNYKTLKLAVNFILILIATLILVFAAVAPDFIKLFATEEYYDAIKLVPVISLSSYFCFLYTVFSNVEFFFAKSKLIAIASITGAGANIILNYLLLPLFGYYAAGYTTCVCYGLYSLVHYVFMKRVCKQELGKVAVYDNRKIFSISTAVTAATFIMLLIYDYWILRYSMLLTLATAVVIKRREILEVLIILKGGKGMKS